LIFVDSLFKVAKIYKKLAQGDGWAEPKNGEAHFGGVGWRCERSEHGKSQLSIKYLCTILPLFLSHYCFFIIPFFQISL